LKFQAFAEKTANYLKGALYCHTLYVVHVLTAEAYSSLRRRRNAGQGEYYRILKTV